MLEIELNTFENSLPALLTTAPGKFVLIKNGDIVGTYSAITDALQFGYSQFKKEPFFVRQILPVQPKLQFANNQILA